MKHKKIPSLLSFAGISLLTLQAIILNSPGQVPREDFITPAHGLYTETYQSDWSQLPTGDALARRDLSDIQFQDVIGENVRAEWRGQPVVHISDLHLRVNWNQSTASKFGTTLFYIEDAEEVIIENLSIISNDPDFRQYHTIFIEGAQRVVIRNLYLAGTVRMYHIRLEGCGEILIDRVEIAGIDYSNNGRHRLGGGIWINNGEDLPGQPPLGAKNPKSPGWQIVQNSYFHDFTEDDGIFRNQDALLVHSASDGILFNCVVQNWLRPAAESSFDLSFRRSEPEFQNRFFRVERNIIENATFYKCVGSAQGANTLFYANNLFVNSTYADYHSGDSESIFEFNTYVFDSGLLPPDVGGLDTSGARVYTRLWSYAAPTFLFNSLIFKADGPFFMFYQNTTPPLDKYLFFKPNHNIYSVEGISHSWLMAQGQGVLFPTLASWRLATSQDLQSALIPADPFIFTDYENGDFRPKTGSMPSGIVNPGGGYPSDFRHAIPRDFLGVSRSSQTETVPGAFCVAPAPPE